MSTPYRVTASSLALCVALAACGSDPFNQDPDISNISLNGQTVPEMQFVSVPMPPPKAPRVPNRAEKSSLWAPGSGGFFADQRAKEVGDILTIIIEISDEASLSNTSSRLRTGGSTIAYPKLFGYGNKLDNILPDVGEDDLPEGEDIVDVGSNITALGRGSIDRDEKISLKVAAMVVQQLPNGNLVIAGRQEVKVNSELRELRVAGIIRPEDVQTNNTIPYDKMAEARITYGGRGQISRQQKSGYGEGALNIILPF
ncbi:flagellar basal body L-ring protein FlgH [Seohaeicola zhoushanensis]|uniref:Flagellar L-ring protein n=1 Tax=Seohaeicola zhoushanensis TaxID=1569283 RepID=A0A8J3M5F2_9RHOB|nr:flagellar basal body L-ring protein FlgH [Seohaeicola zhoushanensis]GHF36215.1 hypothetical protein GCM10017056_05030 [Seohaeicola zhoushanensis]